MTPQKILVVKLVNLGENSCLEILESEGPRSSKHSSFEDGPKGKVERRQVRRPRRPAVAPPALNVSPQSKNVAFEGVLQEVHEGRVPVNVGTILLPCDALQTSAIHRSQLWDAGILDDILVGDRS